MANEATVVSQLTILKGNLQETTLPGSFTATVSGTKGPTPGVVTATTDGVDVDLSELTTPGLCVIRNLDATNWVEVGVYNPDQSEFYPLMRILPGEHYVIRLSPNVNQEYAGTGTGTTGQLNTLRIQSANADVNVQFKAYEA